MLPFKVLCFYYLCSIQILHVSPNENEDVYDKDVYEDDESEYSYTENTTEEYDSLSRDEQLGDSQSVFPLNQYHSSGPQNYFQELLNYPKPLTHHGLKKPKRKLIGKKGYKYLAPLIFSLLSKVAHLLPIVKLTLLALFALVLFSKKALLVSIGSLILVIYDTFYKKGHKGVNVVKDRGSTVPKVEQGSLPEDPTNLEDDWWGRKERNPQLQYREDDKNRKWDRWWAPQVNMRRNLRISPLSSKIPYKKDYFLFSDSFYD